MKKVSALMLCMASISSFAMIPQASAGDICTGKVTAYELFKHHGNNKEHWKYGVYIRIFDQKGRRLDRAQDHYTNLGQTRHVAIKYISRYLDSGYMEECDVVAVNYDPTMSEKEEYDLYFGRGGWEEITENVFGGEAIVSDLRSNNSNFMPFPLPADEDR